MFARITASTRSLPSGVKGPSRTGFPLLKSPRMARYAPPAPVDASTRWTSGSVTLHDDELDPL